MNRPALVIPTLAGLLLFLWLGYLDVIPQNLSRRPDLEGLRVASDPSHGPWRFHGSPVKYELNRAC